MSPVPRHVAAALLLAGASLLLTACSTDARGGTAAPGTSPQPSTASAAAGAGTTWPLTLDNCGTTVTLDAPPERIVTVKSSATELALALGAGDRLVGAAYLDGPFPPEVADQGAAVPVLSDKVPGSEAVLATEPDLVWAGWESVFSGDGAGERGTLQAAGVATYVAPSACKAPGYQPERLTTDLLLAEITEAGRVLGADEAAAGIVAEQRTLLVDDLPAARAGLPTDVPGGTDGAVTALWYSSGTDTPFVGAGIGAPQLVMDLVGLTNIAGDVKDTWTPFSWEQVASEDPDVLVLVDATWNSAAKKIALLEGDPVLSTLTAVKAKRYLVVPFPATEAGLRTLPAALDLVGQLRTVLAPTS